MIGNHAEGMPDGMICKHRAMIELSFSHVKMGSEERAGQSHFAENLPWESLPTPAWTPAFAGVTVVYGRIAVALGLATQTISPLSSSNGE